MSPPSAASGFRRLLPLAWCAAALLLAAHFYTPVTEVLDPSLDISNYASYAAFTAQGRQYGTEVVPFAGPLGFVMYGWVYNADLYSVRFALEFACKLALAVLVLWHFQRTRGAVRWLWLVANLLVLITSELTYDSLAFYAALYLLLARPRPILTVLASGLLALLALGKGTELIATLAMLAVIFAHAAWRRSWRDLALIAGGYGGAFLAGWLATGQHVAHLPVYVRQLFELSSGYNLAMGVQESSFVFILGLTALAALLLTLLLTFLPHRRDPALFAATMLIGGFTLLQWKHGFVRADGHVFLFFYAALLIGLTTLLLDRAAGLAPRWVGPRLALCGVIAACAYAFNGRDAGQRLYEQLAFIPQHFGQSVRQLFHPQAERLALERRLAENRRKFALPEIAAEVGRGSADFFGFELGFIPLNGLRYRPRPVGGGSFSVFTPRLQQLNERFLGSSATRPDFYLLKLQTIDNRLATQDDGTSLTEILHRYRPVVTERSLLLLRAETPPPRLPPLRPLGRQSLRPGVAIEVPAVGPGEVLLAALELPFSPAGSLRSLLYKPAVVSLQLTVDGLPAPVERRVIPSMTLRPFLLSPFTETSSAFLQLYATGAGGPVVRRLQLSAAPAWGLASEGGAIRFYARLRPPPLGEDEMRDLAVNSTYPMANRQPSAIESPHLRQHLIDGHLAQIVEPPGRIVFPLNGNERSLYFTYGLDPDCYDRAQSDGADFAVDLVLPGGSPEQIFISRLEPATVPADRGRHHARLWLPVFPPSSQLILRTGAGRLGVGDWDWTYFDDIRLHAGPLRVEQFPGFAVAPVAASGTWTRMTKLGDEDVLMLNAPGQLVFALHGHERSLHFSGGLLPGSYAGANNTDGAEFIVELLRPAAPAEIIFRRWLQPKSVATDRGSQAFDIPLPATPPGTQLSLRTSTGPHGDAGWDWSYLARVHFE